MSESAFGTGNDCSSLFRRAYENRYTWNHDFKGYSGYCRYQKGSVIDGCNFIIPKDLKPQINDIKDINIGKLIYSQLWEVAIHRVKRSFESVHGNNTFISGDSNSIGMEVLVGGKNKGDSYRVKNDVVTMVNRNIHGSLVNIYTKEIQETGHGYLSSFYTSQYFDPFSKLPNSTKLYYRDQFVQLGKKGEWVLKNRSIETGSSNGLDSEKEEFSFSDLNLITN